MNIILTVLNAFFLKDIAAGGKTGTHVSKNCKNSYIFKIIETFYIVETQSTVVI